jgi:hypothetical protein
MIKSNRLGYKLLKFVNKKSCFNGEFQPLGGSIVVATKEDKVLLKGYLN